MFRIFLTLLLIATFASKGYALFSSDFASVYGSSWNTGDNNGSGFNAWDLENRNNDGTSVFAGGFIQATYIGSPMIYYGTELGMFGADDPEDRMPAKWHDVDIEIQNFYRSVLNLRHSSIAMQKGNFRLIEVNNNYDVLIFERYTDEEVNLVAINRGNQNYNINNYVNNMKLIYSTLAGNSHEKLLPLSASVYSN